MKLTPPQELTTSPADHFLAMIVRRTKWKTTAVPAPTVIPTSASAMRIPTVTPRTVAAALANATSANAGRELMIAGPPFVLRACYLAINGLKHRR